MSYRKISLGWLVALLSAVIVGSFMILHDAFLGNLDAAGGLLQRLLSHGWHVVLYFAIVFPLMNAILQKLLVHPVQKLYLQLYALSKGEIAALVVHSRIAEIQAIEEGINMIIDRLPSYPDESQLETISREVQLLRVTADQLHQGAEPDCRNVLLETVGRIDILVAEARGGAIGT